MVNQWPDQKSQNIYIVTVSQKTVTKTSFVTLFVTNDKITVTKIIGAKIYLPKFTNSHDFK